MYHYLNVQNWQELWPIVSAVSFIVGNLIGRVQRTMHTPPNRYKEYL